MRVQWLAAKACKGLSIGYEVFQTMLEENSKAAANLSEFLDGSQPDSAPSTLLLYLKVVEETIEVIREPEAPPVPEPEPVPSEDGKGGEEKQEGEDGEVAPAEGGVAARAENGEAAPAEGGEAAPAEAAAAAEEVGVRFCSDASCCHVSTRRWHRPLQFQMRSAPLWGSHGLS